jgi:hypothetical protein
MSCFFPRFSDFKVLYIDVEILTDAGERQDDEPLIHYIDQM